MVSPLFQVFSMDRALSTPFSFAQTFAAARAVLFSPNSTTVYKLPSNLIIIPRLISPVFAICLFTIVNATQTMPSYKTYTKEGRCPPNPPQAEQAGEQNYG